MTISRRDFLQAAAAAGFTLAVTANALHESGALPVDTSIPAFGHGIDFDGVLGGIYIMPTDPQMDNFAEVWVVTHPKGTLLMHYAFSQNGGWCWIADPGAHIVGSVNIACSVKAHILLASKDETSK